MPASLIPKDEVLSRLLATFRADGYDGASLAELSEKTGLGKSSLYHHFPGGKAEMATEVLAHLERLLDTAFGTALAAKTPRAKLTRLLAAIDVFYDSGKSACILERLTASVDRARFEAPLRRSFERFVEAFIEVGRAAGLAESVARQRSEDAVVRIEGALVVATGTRNTGVFERSLMTIKSTFLTPPPGRGG
jgi:AcrR family transcriptional regulator